MTISNLRNIVTALSIGLLLFVLLCLTIVVADDEATGAVKKPLVANDQVRVYEVRLQPGAKEGMHSHPTYLYFSRNFSTTRQTFMDGKFMDKKVKAGEVVYSEGTTHATENIGDTEVFDVVVELTYPPTGRQRSNIAENKDPVKIAERNYKILFENERVRVLDVNYQPGQKVNMHSHPATLSYFLTPVKARFISPEGTTYDLEAAEGEAILRDGFSHSVEILSDSSIRILLVEFKELERFGKLDTLAQTKEDKQRSRITVTENQDGTFTTHENSEGTSEQKKRPDEESEGTSERRDRSYENELGRSEQRDTTDENKLGRSEQRDTTLGKDARTAKIELVRGMYDAFKRGDTYAIVEACAENVEWKVYGPEEIPCNGTRHGKKQVEEFFAKIKETMRFDKCEPQEFFCDQDTVIVFGMQSGTAIPTGKKFESPWVMSFKIQNGKVVKFCEYYDTAAFLKAFREVEIR